MAGWLSQEGRSSPSLATLCSHLRSGRCHRGNSGVRAGWREKPASDRSQGQLCRWTCGLLASTACGLLLVVVGRSSSGEQTGTRPCGLKLLKKGKMHKEKRFGNRTWGQSVQGKREPWGHCFCHVTFLYLRFPLCKTDLLLNKCERLSAMRTCQAPW